MELLSAVAADQKSALSGYLCVHLSLPASLSADLPSLPISLSGVLHVPFSALLSMSLPSLHSVYSEYNTKYKVLWGKSLCVLDFKPDFYKSGCHPLIT